MNSIVASSCRIVSRRAGLSLFARRTTVVAVPRATYELATRTYAKKPIDAVVSEKQRKQEFVRMLEDEVNVLKNTLEESEANSLSSEVTERFLKETGYELTENHEDGIVKLSRTVGDKTVEITFPDTPEDYQQNESEYDEERDEEESEEQEEQEEEQEEEEDEGTEHAFTVEVKSNKSEKSFLFQCHANIDGSFIVSKLTTGDHIPVQIQYWSADLQKELIQYFETLGVNERLANFIHQYIAQRVTTDNVKILEDFKEFVNTK